MTLVWGIALRREEEVKMPLAQRFNLVDEPWVPVAGKGLVSLATIFSDHSLSALGGNPVQKIAMTKLLLAIAQSAHTPANEEEWQRLGPSGVMDRATEYLSATRDLFWLYGERPFLQVPVIAKAEKQGFGAVQIHTASGNTTVLTESQVETPLTDADKAMLVVQLMGFGLGGKKTDNSVTLSAGYSGKSNEKGKPSTGKPGPSLGFLGFLHTYLQGESLGETLWLNLLTKEEMKQLTYFSEGFGVAPWENMPQGEACATANRLKSSYMGRLTPVSRFVLLAEDGLHYSEGIAHQGYAEGLVDPSVAVTFSGAKTKALWADPEKRPWRQLPALLSFLDNDDSQGAYECRQLWIGVPRAKKHLLRFGIWSGGLKVSNNAGEQYVSGADDFVESEIYFDSPEVEINWFTNFKREMKELDQLAKYIWSATNAYFVAQKAEGKDQAAQAVNLFWQLCERRLQDLVDACNDDSDEQVKRLRRVIAGFAKKSYDTHCPKDTARQVETWAANRPNLFKYLQ